MIKLTQTVQKGGCAAKVPAVILREILAGVTFPPNIPGVTVDGALFDDAAIFQINDDVSLVQTLDFFTPIINTPYDFGAVAAANALSDVYAMGGRPKTCMAILAAPLAVLEPSVIKEVLQGAADTITAAKASLVGGHSIDDDTLKFGLSVTGLVHPKQVWSNNHAGPGDKLILTKPIGTGTICAGLKRDTYTEADMSDALASMKRLNNAIDFLSADELSGIHAATDITGFGVAGHGMQMALASDVTLKLETAKIPLFRLTIASLDAGHMTKAHRSNFEYTKDKTKMSAQGQWQNILCDPQTSGGLLLSVAPELAETIVARLAAHFPGTAVVGEVLERKAHSLHVD